TLRLKQMTRYFSRPCPRCGSFFGLVLRQASSQPRVLSVDGLCITCRYGINWALVRGRALAIKVHKKRLPIRATRPGLYTTNTGLGLTSSKQDLGATPPSHVH